MSEEFILKKEGKSFQRPVDTIIEKEKIMAILSKFTVLCLSYFAIYYKDMINFKRCSYS